MLYNVPIIKEGFAMTSNGDTTFKQLQRAYEARSLSYPELMEEIIKLPELEPLGIKEKYKQITDFFAQEHNKRLGEVDIESMLPPPPTPREKREREAAYQKGIFATSADPSQESLRVILRKLYTIGDDLKTGNPVIKADFFDGAKRSDRRAEKLAGIDADKAEALKAFQREMARALLSTEPDTFWSYDSINARGKFEKIDDGHKGKETRKIHGLVINMCDKFGVIRHWIKEMPMADCVQILTRTPAGPPPTPVI